MKLSKFFSLATLALIAAVSCQKEELVAPAGQKSVVVGDNIEFSVNSSSDAKTKAAGALTLFSADGDSLCINLSVADNLGIKSLPDQMSQTKGALIDGGLLGYYNIGVSAYLNDSAKPLYFTDEIARVDGSHSYDPDDTDSQVNNWTAAGHWAPIAGHTYYWPKAIALDFWAWAPASQMAASNTNVSDFGVDSENKNLSFTYTLPNNTAATAMPDLMFSYTADVSKDNVQSKNPTGCVPLEFKHALAAVKFQVNADYPGTVTRISIGSATNSGTCSFNGDFTWTPGTTTATFAQAFTTEQGAVPTPDIDVLPYVYETIGGQNYNSAIFMLIPQTLAADGQTVSITFNYTGKESKTYTGYLKAGNVDKWEAGKVYTYTITIPNVNVSVEDEIANSIKQKVDITNTGNVNAYIRATIIGHWADKSGRILNTPWDMTTANGTWDSAHQDTDGSFKPSTNWVKGSDGYFYYKHQVAPGAVVSEDLFTTYTPTRTGMGSAHLDLFISVQAVPANRIDEAIANGWDAKTKINYDTTVDSGRDASTYPTE